MAPLKQHLPIKGKSLTAVGVTPASRSSKMKKATKMFIPARREVTAVDTREANILMGEMHRELAMLLLLTSRRAISDDYFKELQRV